MEAGDQSFYWQPPTTAVYRRRRPPSPSMFDSSLAIFLLPCLALLFLFFLIHTFSHRSPPQQQYYNVPPIYQNQIPNPVALPPPPKPAQFFRRGWDSLNVVLILAAILCGVFARRNEDARPPVAALEIRNVNFRSAVSFPKHDQFSFPDFQHQEQQQQLQVQQFPPFQHQPWCQFADNRRIYDFSPRRSFGGGGAVHPEIGGGGLRRANSAHPEFMRQEASLWEEEANRPLRFFDDLEINRFYSPPESNYARNLENQAATSASVEDSTATDDGIEIKEIPVANFVDSTEDLVPEEASASAPEASPPPPMSLAPAPPPPPPPVSRSKQKRTYQSLPRKEKSEKSVPPPTPAPTEPPPLPLPPPEPPQKPEKKLRRRKSNTTKEITMMLASVASLYNTGKRKRKHQKSHKPDPQISDETPEVQRFPPPSPPPPPPPLPPPPSIFSNIFKKSTKNKKIHSVATAPPQPPPPPPMRKILDPQIADPQSRGRTNSSSKKPPLPTRRSNYSNGDESPFLDSGSQSPLVQIPNPPPLPPFRMTEMRFAAVGGGEFVQIRSALSSRAGSPEPVGEEAGVTATVSKDKSGPSDGAEINDGDGKGPTAGYRCPSPDVNTKADSFIARHHDGWRLEKLNSWREKKRA